ncbi:MAG: hypothetical protein IKY84_06920 [Bacteroidaceae bacterium]|nr:hypothetical protein [Bacteroidaceae bacterium]
MSVVQERNTLKGYFKKGSYPTQEQFELLIDSLRHKNDRIHVSLIEGLTELLNEKADSSVGKALQDLLGRIERGEIGGGMTADEREMFESLLGMFSIDEERGWLRVNGPTKRYFMSMTELSMPNAPEIATTTYYVVTGNASVGVTNKTSGATMKYSTDGGVTWSDTTGTISLASGYSNTASNVVKTVNVLVKAVKNGEESEINEYLITIKPKVASGNVSVVRNGNNNDYSTSATITLTPSPTVGAVSSYSEDGGKTWTVFTAATTKTTTTSKSASVYQVKAVASESMTAYQDAATVTSSAFTLNKKKFYYGRGGATLSSEADIKALTGGSSVEKGTMAGSYSITSTEAGKYTWFCGTGTLSNVTAGGFAVPMESVKVVDGYNCYRSSSPVMEIGTDTFTVL